MTTYVTVQGDKWDLIAHKTLGDTSRADKLIRANVQYADIYIFHAGVELRIPDVTTDVKNDDLPPWKRA